MEILQLIVQNRELMKLIYALIITLICIVITFKSDRIYRLSSYRGIRYFRNAFFFYGIAFVIRYFAGSGLFNPLANVMECHILVKMFFEFFLVMAGFFLLYSLLWKKIESYRETYASSLLNMKVLLFYLMAVLIVSLDYLWNSYIFMFTSQILVFALTFAISLVNYHERGKNRKFLKFYCFSMFLALVAWMLNALAAMWLNWNIAVVMTVYLLNILMFLIFWIGIVRVTKRN